MPGLCIFISGSFLFPGRFALASKASIVSLFYPATAVRLPQPLALLLPKKRLQIRVT